jgi:hypothetical protein
VSADLELQEQLLPTMVEILIILVFLLREVLVEEMPLLELLQLMVLVLVVVVSQQQQALLLVRLVLLWAMPLVELEEQQLLEQEL